VAISTEVYMVFTERLCLDPFSSLYTWISPTSMWDI